MIYLQNINEFNLFKRKISKDDEIALEFIDRLKKVKDKNPYEIRNITYDYPTWVSGAISRQPESEREVYNLIYLVRFEDVELLITNDRHGIIYHGQRPLGAPDFKKNKYKYKLFIAEERVFANEKYRKKIFNIVDKIFKEDKDRKRIDKIQTEINPAADIL